MAYEVKVFEDGEELSVIEVDTKDSGDPDTIQLVVYAWRREQ
jgi:hypothetical protein